MAPIQLDLLVPRVKLGPIPMSVAKMPLGGGVSIAYILDPLCIEPSNIYEEAGHTWDRFKLSLEQDQGLEVPIRGYGRIGFYNHKGLLRISVPSAVASVLDAWRNFQEGPVVDEGTTVTGTFRVQPGLRGSFRVLGHSIEVRAPDTPGLVRRTVR